MENGLLQEINQALEKTQHPSINASLPQLGMLTDVKIAENEVLMTLKLPFAGIPENVRNLMIGNIQDVLNRFGMKIKLKLTIMDEEEKQHFLKVEKANWKGAPQ
ncbi:MAG: iron-sulfur cluster assembly protein [Promethearchaeota archaeon]